MITNHVVTPGEPLYGLNLDGVAATGSGEPESSSLADTIVFKCSGALISDRHVLTAAHFLDTDEDGNVDFLTRSFTYVAGFTAASRDGIRIGVPADRPQFSCQIGGRLRRCPHGDLH